MVAMDINVLVRKHNAIDIIANVIVQVFIVQIAIAKIAKINHLKIMYQIDIKLLQLNQKVKQLHALVLKVAVIKNIVNVIKMGVNAILLVDVLDARIQKTLLMEKKLEKIMNVVQRIVFIYLKIKFMKKKLEKILVKKKNIKEK